MIGINKLTNPKVLAILITIFFAFNSIYTASASQHIDYNEDVNRDVFDDFDWENGIPDTNVLDSLDLNGNADYDSDVGQFLSDNENDYSKVWDPWVSKAAIHAVATTEDGDKLALAGGYLYDNQIHLYQWNYQTYMYDLVWEIGGGIFQSDVTSLAFADTDYNNLTEIIAGGEDGVLYVFEQRHIYDPVTNMENMYDLVWKSPRLGRIFDVMVYDTDGDYRQDIIVGTGDTVRWYEYDTHGNYPFSEEHWIEFREVFSYKLPSYVTALGVSDVNSNGLKEVAAGTRSGKIYLLENNGTSLKINNYWYPIIQDNSYRYLWDSGTIIRRPISDMVGGDLDQDGQNELMIAVQGQGAYVLDTIDGVYGVYRLQRDFAKWETNPVEIYPLDVYTDAMINSSSWFNNTDLTKLQSNVYYQNATSFWPEPLNYTEYGNFIIYPYSSYSVMNQQPQPDGRYTTFWAGKITAFYNTAWAVYDWGNDEEAAGNGISSLPDMKIHVESINVDASQLNISISQDNVNWFNVNTSLYVRADAGGTFYTVEVDPTMGDADINYYRYIKLEVLTGLLKVDVLETMAWNNPIYDALSVETGFMTFKNDETPTPVGFIGTIDGGILAVTWDAARNQYVVSWDSWVDERWKMKTNIFDLETVKHTGRFPGWIDKGTFSNTLNLGLAPDGGKVVSYTAENFYNFQNENVVEIVVVSDLGGIFVYQQWDPNFPAQYNPQLTTMLFGNKQTNIVPQYGVQDWITHLNAQGLKYVSMSILPIDVWFKSTDSFAHEFNPYSNGFMLYIGAWAGTMGNLDVGNLGTPVKGEVDVSLWYLASNPSVETSDPTDALTCDAFSLPICSYFNPLYQEGALQDYYSSITAGLASQLASLSSIELTGQMWGTFASSTWMPKVAAGDFISNEINDYIVTNGKLTLLEASFGLGQTQSTPSEFSFNSKKLIPAEVSLQTIPVYSEFNFVVKGGYFDTINENSKGRHWSNANPVDFDGDGDMDLILGFATYSVAEFGFDKVTFGATYWENEGTREEPIWVEKPLAMTNTDPDSGFRAQNYTDPLVIYEEYDMTKVLSSSAGYHHSYRTDRPTRIMMWQPIDHQNIFEGQIRSFHATYDHPTSLLAATYPEAKRIDINLQYVKQDPLNQDYNFGFHIFETWDNSEELNEWTLSLSTADLDQDGRNEIVVGDFNNNIYVFEHLSNNTYKRAFKSFDINRTITTNESPYSHDLFDGISGEFQRTLFDHVKFLNAGFDLNNNSLQEFVAATDNMIFIFEATTTPTGRIQDDTYKLIRTIDLLDNRALLSQRSEDTVITAITWADDMTLDGRRELIIAATSALLIFEVEKAPKPGYKEDGEFIVEEIFFGDAYDLIGLYDLPGNYFVRPYHSISALLVEDLDNDGFMDLAVGGTDRAGPRPLYNGFVSIYEYRSGGFRTLEPEGTFDEMVQYNPVNDFAVDDADFDGVKELLVGHNYGIDIYEFPSDDTVVLQEVITSSPHYPFPDRYRLTSLNTLNEHKDVIRHSNGKDLIMVYSDISGTSRLLMAVSSDEGKTWDRSAILANDRIGYTYATGTDNPSHGVGYTFLGAEEPSLVYDNNDNLWLSFTEKFVQDSSGLILYDIFVIKNPVRENANNNLAYYAYLEAASTGSQENTPTPRLFNIYDYFGNNKIGMVMSSNLDLEANVFRNSMRFLKIDITLTGVNRGGSASYSDRFVYEGLPSVADWANGTVIPNHFSVEGLDIVQLDGNSNKYGVTFAGYPWAESLSMDLDLYYDVISINSTSNWLFNMTTPNRMFASGMVARNPSIIQEHDTGNLLVTFEQQTLRPYGGLFAIWSNDRGTTWNGPHDMSHPLGLDIPLLIEALPTKSQESYVIAATIGFEAITEFEARVPVVVPGGSRGFTMVYTAQVEFVIGGGERKGSRIGLCSQDPDGGSQLLSHKSNIPNQCDRGIDLNFLVSAINPWSNFTWYELGAANAIVVGDTDRDSRHEILVASGKQAFLYEFSQNAVGYIKHVQKWVSDPYDRDITGIAISDANGNGFPEIILESERGIVQTFEVTDTLQNTADLMYFLEEHQVDSPSTGPGNSIVSIIAADLNSDGTEDFVYVTMAGEVVAVDGSDYSQMWAETLTATGTPVYLHQKDKSVHLDIVRDSTSDDVTGVVVAIGTWLYNFDDPTNGGVPLDYNYATGGDQDVKVIRTADVISGASEEILVGLSNGTIFLMRSDALTPLWNYDFDLGFIPGSLENDPTDIQVAQFTNNNVTEVVILNNGGNVTLLTGSNGDMEWETGYPADSKNSGLALTDTNGDGKLDLIYGKNSTFALSGLTGDQLWNSSTSIFDTRKRVAILRDGDTGSANQIQSDLAPIGINVDIIDVGTTPTYDQLSPYGLLFLVSDDGTIGNREEVGNVLAEYIDKGGKLVNFAYTYVDIWGLRGSVYSGGYLPLKANNNDNNPTSYDGLSTHVVLDGITTLNTVSMDVDLSMGAEVIANHGDGSPMIVLKGNVMTVNSAIGTASGNVAKLFQNIATYMVNRDSVAVQDPVVYDVDDDGVDDVIYSMYHSTGNVAMYAISGANGEVLWTYSPSTPFDGRSVGKMKLFSLDADNDVLIFQTAASTSDAPGLVILLDPATGVARGGIPVPVGGVAIEVSNLGESEPQIIVGDGEGIVRTYSIWNGLTPVTPATIGEIGTTPFFWLDTAFTRRTEYLMYDFIQSPLLSPSGQGDGIDDVIILDDFYIASADTYSLLEDPDFEEVEWQIVNATMGRYLGGAQLLSNDSDAAPELIIAPFENALYAIDIKDGSVEWEFNHKEFDDHGRLRDFRMQIGNLDGAVGNGDEIVYTRLFSYFSWPISEIVTLRNDGNLIKNIYVPLSKNFVINLGEFDTGAVDIVYSVQYFYNPLISLFGILDGATLASRAGPFPLVGMFPITEIATGDFEDGVAGDEFILFFEMAELNLPDIIYSLIGFPTLFIQFAWNGAALTLPIDGGNPTNLIGFSPTGEPTENYWVETVTDVGGGVHPYLIVESRNGDMFNYDLSMSGVLMNTTGIITDKAIPYSKTTFALTGQGAGREGLCGPNSFITLTAANSMTCYYTEQQDLNFDNLKEDPDSLVLEFGVIQDVVIADLDDDNIDDILVASYPVDGQTFIWVVRSNPPPSPLLHLSADSLLTENIPNSVQKDTPTPLIILGFGTSFMTGLLVILKKKKMLPI